MRRRLLIGGAVSGGLLLIFLFCAWYFYGQVGAWAIRHKVMPRMSSRLGQTVTIGEIQVGRGQALLRNVAVGGDKGDLAPLVQVDRIDVTYDYWASWLGQIAIDEVAIHSLRVHARKLSDGTTNFQGLVDRLQPPEKTEGELTSPQSTSSNLGKLRPRLLSVSDAELHFMDESSGTQMHASGLTARELKREDNEVAFRVESITASAGVGPEVNLGSTVFTVNLAEPLASARAEVGSGHVTLWEGMRLTGINGQIAPGDNLGEMIVNLSGSYGGSTETLWQAEGWLEPKAKRGLLAVKADRFTLDKIANVLEDSMVQDYESTSIDAEFSLELDSNQADFSGRLAITGLTIDHPKLSEETIRDVSFQGDLVASFDSMTRSLHLARMAIVSKGVTYDMSAKVEFEGGLEPDGTIREFSRLAFVGTVPTTSCQLVLNSIPQELIPKLRGFRLDGLFDADVRLVIDWGDLANKTVFDANIGLPNCRVIRPAHEFNTRRLMSGFSHETLIGPDMYESVEIGMASPNYAQIIDISPYLIKSVLTHEDSRFYEHNGFIVPEFRGALIKNLEEKRFVRGASSITMQMVKNVFLYRDKTMSRKFQELFLTWYVEKSLEKDRILEIYLNAIEYGPGIYGIVRASELFFGKHPRDIEPREAAFLADLLPAPRKRYFQYCKDRVDKRTGRKIIRILTNMHHRDRLTDDEFFEAMNSTIKFNPVKDSELCRKMPSW